MPGFGRYSTHSTSILHRKPSRGCEAFVKQPDIYKRKQDQGIVVSDPKDRYFLFVADTYSPRLTQRAVHYLRPLAAMATYLRSQDLDSRPQTPEDLAPNTHPWKSALHWVSKHATDITVDVAQKANRTEKLTRCGVRSVVPRLSKALSIVRLLVVKRFAILSDSVILVYSRGRQGLAALTRMCLYKVARHPYT